MSYQKMVKNIHFTSAGFNKLLEKNGYFSRQKTDIFSYFCVKTDISHDKMTTKRIFVRNIPLLIEKRFENREKYMFRAGSGPVLTVKNIPSEFLEYIHLCLKNICSPNNYRYNGANPFFFGPWMRKNEISFSSSFGCEARRDFDGWRGLAVFCPFFIDAKDEKNTKCHSRVFLCHMEMPKAWRTKFCPSTPAA